jgi:hypothetical protein
MQAIAYDPYQVESASSRLRALPAHQDEDVYLDGSLQKEVSNPRIASTAHTVSPPLSLGPTATRSTPRDVTGKNVALPTPRRSFTFSAHSKAKRPAKTVQSADQGHENAQQADRQNNGVDFPSPASADEPEQVNEPGRNAGQGHHDADGRDGGPTRANREHNERAKRRTSP